MFLVIICFPLLLSLLPQLIINFYGSQLSQSLRTEVLALAGLSQARFTFHLNHLPRHLGGVRVRQAVPGPPWSLWKAVPAPVVPAAAFGSRQSGSQKDRSARSVASWPGTTAPQLFRSHPASVYDFGGITNHLFGTSR